MAVMLMMLMMMTWSESPPKLAMLSWTQERAAIMSWRPWLPVIKSCHVTSCHVISVMSCNVMLSCVLTSNAVLASTQRYPAQGAQTVVDGDLIIAFYIGTRPLHVSHQDDSLRVHELLRPVAPRRVVAHRVAAAVDPDHDGQGRGALAARGHGAVDVQVQAVFLTCNSLRVRVSETLLTVHLRECR